MGKWAVVQCNCPDRERLSPARQGDYACGHKEGAIIAFAPSSLIEYGQNLERIYKHRPEMFEVWRRISDWRNYCEEYLSLSPDEAAIWRLEIEQLQRLLIGEEFMGWNQTQLLNRLREEERQQDAHYGREPSSVQEVIAQGLALCRASEETEKPIEFFW